MYRGTAVTDPMARALDQSQRDSEDATQGVTSLLANLAVVESDTWQDTNKLSVKRHASSSVRFSPSGNDASVFPRCTKQHCTSSSSSLSFRFLCLAHQQSFLPFPFFRIVENRVLFARSPFPCSVSFPNASSVEEIRKVKSEER